MENIPQENHENIEQNIPPVAAPEPSHDSRGKKTLLVILLLVLAAIIGFICYKYMNKNKLTQEEAVRQDSQNYYNEVAKRTPATTDEDRAMAAKILEETSKNNQ